MKKFLVYFGLLSFLANPAWATSTTISTASTSAQSLNTGDSLTITSAGTLTIGGSTVAVTVNGNSTIDNFGTINQTSTGRAIRSVTTGTVLTVTNEAGATIKTTGNDAFQMNKTGTVTLNNYGAISASASGAQAINWNVTNSSGTDALYSNTLYNYAHGTITATEADAMRPGAGGTIYNSGTIKSTTSTGASSDGIDAQTNNSAITIINDASQTTGSGATNLIEGGRHGITGGQDVDTKDTSTYGLAFTMSITNNTNGTIQGDNGSGVNIDGVGANEVVTITNHGNITGNGVTGDGDGVDVDGLVNLTNTGTILSKNAYADTSEGVTVGGGTIFDSGTIEGSVTTAGATSGSVGRGITLAGVDKTVFNSVDTTIPVQKIYANTTVTNNAGGLIKGDSDSGIAILGITGATNYSVTITNNAGATIEGAGSVAVIDGSATAGGVGTASANNETVINYGTIQVDGTGKAISLGSGTNSVQIMGGTASINGDISGGTSAGSNSLVIDPTAGNSFSYSHSLSNFNSVEIKSGTVNLSGTNTYTGGTTIDTSSTLNVSGSIGNSATAVNGGNLHLSSGTTGAVTLNSGGSLTGNGTVGALTVNSGGTLSPGNSPGVINAGNTVFNSGGSMLLQVDTDGGTGTAGTNWDKLAITGTLDVSSLNPSGTFQFKLQTLNGSDVAGLLGTFDATVNHTWTDIITTTGGFIGTLNSSSFSFDTSLFQNSLDGGSFKVTQDTQNANDLDLQFTAETPEPGTWAMLLAGFGLLMVLRRLRRQEIA